MTIAATLQRFLTDQAIAYDVLTHTATGSSSETAQATHISGNRIAKAVLLSDNGGYVLAVLPASHHLRLEWVEQVMGRAMALASEAEAGRLFPDCEVGAIPPVGQAYGLDVILDDGLSGQDQVCFEGGDHRSLIRVDGDTFAKLMAPVRHGTISAHD